MKFVYTLNTSAYSLSLTLYRQIFSFSKLENYSTQESPGRAWFVSYLLILHNSRSRQEPLE